MTSKAQGGITCGRIAQLVERGAYTSVVPGSSPGAPTRYVILVDVCDKTTHVGWFCVRRRLTEGVLKPTKTRK